MAPRRPRRDADERALAALARMSLGTLSGRVESASPSRKLADPRITQVLRGSDCDCPMAVRLCEAPAPGASEYSVEVAADDPVLHYRMGDASGTVAQDQTANNYDGTYHGTPTLGAPGLTGDGDTAAGFNESDSGATVGTDYVTTPPIDLTGGAGFSLEILIKPSATFVPTSNLAYGPHGTFQDVNTFGISDSTPRAQFRFNASDIVIGTTEIEADGAYCCVVTWDEASGDGYLYVDGSVEDSINVPGFSPGNDIWTLADTDDTNSNARYRGILDEFSLYDHALSGARVAAHCAAVGGGPLDPCALLASDGLLMIDASLGDATVAMVPAEEVAGHIFYVKKVDNTDSVVTLDPNGSEQIDGSASFALYDPWDTVCIISDGVNWWVL